MPYMYDRPAGKLQPRDSHEFRGERLDQLGFQDALKDCIALSELAMDMVDAFSSREELIWIQNGFKPSRQTRSAKPKHAADLKHRLFEIAGALHDLWLRYMVIGAGRPPSG